MNILFRIPHLKPSGGVKVIYRLSELLADKGIKSLILASNMKSPESSLIWLAEEKSKCKIGHISELPKINLSAFSHIIEYGDSIPIPKHKNNKHILYLQGFGTQNSNIEAKNLSYRYNQIITTSNWLANIARSFGHKNIEVIPPGIDALFEPINCNKKYSLSNFFTIGCLYHESKEKNINKTVQVLNYLVNMRRFKCMFISSKLPSQDIKNKMAFSNSFIVNPLQRLLPVVYSNCDIWISLCKKEGFGLPILEAMSCKCPVITSVNSGLDYYLKSDINCKILQTESIKEITDTIGQITYDNIYREKLIHHGYKLAKQFTWEKTIDKFIEILKRK